MKKNLIFFIILICIVYSSKGMYGAANQPSVDHSQQNYNDSDTYHKSATFDNIQSPDLPEQTTTTESLLQQLAQITGERDRWKKRAILLTIKSLITGASLFSSAGYYLYQNFQTLTDPQNIAHLFSILLNTTKPHPN